MVVQHNMQAMNANRMLNITTGAQSKSTEKLSSGYRINRAADDAAGLTISEKMRKQIRGLDQASTNAQDGVSSVQTAEGALTEVHSMLQRMNELAVQAANGTNSKESDRQAIQDEIDQLTTEIDRVAETTKFNEIYLLKGDNASTKNVYMKGHDAGLKGTLTDSAKSATFVMDTLKAGDKYKIAGKEYTIGTDKAEIVAAINQYQAADKEITVDGTSYTYKEATTGGNAKAAGWYKDGDQTNGTAVTAANLVKDGSKATVDGKEYAAMNDADGDGVDDDDSSIISTTEAKKKIKAELLAANSIGTVNRDATVSDGADANGKTSYTISKGYATVADTLSFNLHVGADADMTNKITVDIDVMNSANLGVKGLNVTDATGTAATYAVDAISDAIAKVSSQRSALGAVQNRLEHTIDNLDNIVENTTTAESRIRDTDMAEEMVEYSKNNILAQAGQSMLAQANQSTQGVLSLLQ
ncbi:flagellin [Roseburia inulinivorans]|jgi:flagellin|uniref:Flagellin n=1 Tax=Roseburia inulinivorans TaxID=360807 RepID=A0A3R6C6F6_9FIRM|nr:flagellin [Roseburia inulinivorans]RHE89467.1 flagellar hook protein [Roseburia inulinivorans]